MSFLWWWYIYQNTLLHILMLRMKLIVPSTYSKRTFGFGIQLVQSALLCDSIEKREHKGIRLFECITTDSEKWERTFWMGTKRKKKCGEFRKMVPLKGAFDDF